MGFLGVGETGELGAGEVEAVEGEDECRWGNVGGFRCCGGGGTGGVVGDDGGGGSGVEAGGDEGGERGFAGAGDAGDGDEDALVGRGFLVEVCDVVRSDVGT